MSSTFGKNIRISIFGQSHSEAIGVVIDRLPAGCTIDFDQLDAFMQRRQGGSSFSTPRKEADKPEILSGIVDSKTCGAPLAAVIRNGNTRSSDYDEIRKKPRPAHADYTSRIKYGGYNDISGGGHFSGRLTAALCVAGGICKQILAQRDILIGAHIAKIGTISDDRFNPVGEQPQALFAAGKKRFAVLNDEKGELMQQAIKLAREQGDSLGGVIECMITGVPLGLGNPMFDGVENRLAQAVFAIPAVKGIEFGNGFASSEMTGSQNNDEFYYDENGCVKTRSNNHGGILGGITSSMPIIFRAAIKPTPSISMEQKTIDLSSQTDATLSIKGRHDPCIVPRAVACIEAAAAIVMTDLLLDSPDCINQL